MTPYIKIDNHGGFQLKEINYDPQLTPNDDKQLMLDALYQATNLLEEPEISLVKSQLNQTIKKATKQIINPTKPVINIIECNTKDKLPKP